MITSKKVVRIVGKTWLVSSSFRELWRPNTLVGILSLMDCHVWWPDSVMDLSLSKVPLLEVVTTVLLVTWVNLWKINHL